MKRQDKGKRLQKIKKNIFVRKIVNKEEYSLIHDFFPPIQFNMSLDDSAEQDNEILCNLRDFSASELWENNQFSKEQIKSGFERLIQITQKIYSKNLQLAERQIELRQQIFQLQQKQQELQEHNRVLQDDCHNIKVLMTQLQENKERQIQQISYSEEEIRKSCMEMSHELENFKTIKTSFFLAEEETKRKDQQIKMLEVQLQRKINQNKYIENELSETRNQLAFVSLNLQKAINELKNERDQHLKMRQQNQQLMSKSEEYKYILNVRMNKPEDIFQSEAPSSEERHSTIMECNNQDDHEMLRTIQKICEEDYIVSQLKKPLYTVTDLPLGNSSKKMPKRYQEPYSERKMKKSERNRSSRILIDEDKESIDKRSISGISATSIHQIFADRMKAKETLDKKYSRQMIRLRKQNVSLKQQIEKKKHEVILCRDKITQIQGQLQMNQDQNDRILNPYREAIFQYSHMLQTDKQQIKNLKEQHLKQRINFENMILSLKLQNDELAAYNKELKNRIKDTLGNISGKIQKHSNKLIFEQEEQTKNYKFSSLKNRIFQMKAKKLSVCQADKFSILPKKTCEKQSQTQKEMKKSESARTISAKIQNEYQEDTKTDNSQVEKFDWENQTIYTNEIQKKEKKELFHQSSQCAKSHCDMYQSYALTIKQAKKKVDEGVQTKQVKNSQNMSQTENLYNVTQNNFIIQTNISNSFNFKGQMCKTIEDRCCQTQIEKEDKYTSIVVQCSEAQTQTQVDEVDGKESRIDQVFKGKQIKEEDMSMDFSFEDFGFRSRTQLIVEEIQEQSFNTIKQIHEHNYKIRCEVNMIVNESRGDKVSFRSFRNSNGSDHLNPFMKENASQNIEIKSKHSRQSSKSSFFTEKNDFSIDHLSKNKSKSRRKSTFSFRDFDLLKSKKSDFKRIQGPDHQKKISIPKIMTERLDSNQPEPSMKNQTQTHFPKSIVDNKSICPYILTADESKFLKKFLPKERLVLEVREEKIFTGFNWNPDKLYVCEGKIVENDQDDKIVLWQRGLVSMLLHKAVLMRKSKRGIKDESMYILGNCEIVAEDNKVCLKRARKRTLFEGNLGDNVWKLEKISVYNFQ